MYALLVCVSVFSGTSLQLNLNHKTDTSRLYDLTLAFDLLDCFQSGPHTAWQTQAFISVFLSRTHARTQTHTHGDRSCLQLTGFYISKDIKLPTPTLPPPWPYDHAMMRDGTICSVTAPLIQWHTDTHTSQRQICSLSEHKIIEGKAPFNVRLHQVQECVDIVRKHACTCVCVSACVWQPLKWRLCKTLVHHNCDVLARGLSGGKQFPSRYTRRILTSRNRQAHKHTHA